jgi:multidrug resistance efflux pump
MTNTDTLEREVVDTAPESSEPAAVEPPARTGFFRGARKWRNRAIVLLMAAATAFGAVQLIHHQSATSAELKLTDVVLTSQPIPVQAPQSGLVTSVSVHAGDRVRDGQALGTIDVTTTNAKGRAVTDQVLLRAPRTGFVVDDPLTVGSSLQPGASFVQIYDPADLRLVTSVPLSYLPRISVGMKAKLTAPGVPGVVTAVLQRAVPRVGTSDQDVPKGSLQLVFIASDDAQVAKLIPGLRFHGTIDTGSGSGHGSSAQYVGSR